MAMQVRLDVHLDPRSALRADQAHAAVNEAREVLHLIQNRLHCQLRGWWFFFHTRFLSETAQGCQPRFRFPGGASTGARRNAPRRAHAPARAQREGARRAGAAGGISLRPPQPKLDLYPALLPTDSAIEPYLFGLHANDRGMAYAINDGKMLA